MAKFTINCLFKCLACFLQFKSLYSETILGEETDEFDFDGLPGAQHEFRLHVGAWREECFYQRIREGANVKVSYEVLRGGDRNVDVFLRGPNHTVIDSILNKPFGEFETVVVETGDYSICIDNTLSRFTSKLVHFFMLIYVRSELEEYVKELETLNLAVSNFTTSINSVQFSIKEVLLFQSIARMHSTRDWILGYNKRIYVQYWAILHCAIFIVTSVFQVYFVRRLFRYTNVTPTEKPRA